MILRVINSDGKRPEDLTGELAEKLKEAIYQYDGRMTLAAAVGVLHIVAAEIIRENGDA